MLPHHLLQLAILAMAAVAAPTPPRYSFRPRPPSESGPPAKRPKSGNNDLFDLIDNLDVRTDFKMATPPATGSNTLSETGAQHLPSSIMLTAGAFQPEVILSDPAIRTRFLVDANTYAQSQTLFEAAKLSKDYVTIPVSGEGGLSHLLYQQIGGILNGLLQATRTAGAWSIRARGAAPIEDWQYVISDSRATTLTVLELKTPDSLPLGKINTIVDMVKKKRFSMRQSDATTGIINFLYGKSSASKEDIPKRKGRKTEVLAMEQVGNYSAMLMAGHRANVRHQS